MPLQACANVSLENVAVLSECCPSSRDSSLKLLVLVFVYGAVSLSLPGICSFQRSRSECC